MEDSENIRRSSRQNDQEKPNYFESDCYVSDDEDVYSFDH